MTHTHHSRPRSATTRRRLILVLAAGLVALLAETACDEPTGSQPVTEAVSGDWIHVFFTNPTSPDDETLHQGGLDEELAAVIGEAQEYVDVAAYDLDLARVADALIAAHDAGIQVRVVVDVNNGDEVAVADLWAAGVPLVEADRGGGRGLMHDKFVVIDGEWVWTGSWNLTENGTYRNNNNAVLIASNRLAENYHREFEELFTGQIGAGSPADTPNPLVTITSRDGDTEHQVIVENYFAPEDGVAQEIIAEIEGAESRVRFLAFSFTSDEIAAAMLERAQAGVIVQGVMEGRDADNEHSECRRLQAAVHDVLLDGNPYVMHHKVIIVDDETVILGSYNFSRNAEEYNDENVLIIHDPAVATLFVAEFGRVYEQARAAE